MKYLTAIILSISFVTSCAPPPGWKSKSRLFSQSTHASGKNLKDSQTVRVLIYQGTAVKIDSNSKYEFRNTQNEVIKGNGGYLPKSSGKFISENGEFTLNKNIYYGEVLVLNDNHQFSYINHVPMEEYLISVVGHEMSPKWPLDALKAQAVVARTYVAQKMIENHEKLYDIGITTKDQVYGGKQEGDEVVRQAIAETRSQVIIYKGEMAKVFFHSCCGGETASSAEVWHEDLPYLQKRTCNFKDSPEYNWKLVLSKKEMEDKLGISGISQIIVKDRTESKRVKNIGITSGGKQNEISASEFRTKIGVEKIRSTRFGMKIKDNTVIIKGHGYGHGVGLCQWCSKIMAEKRSMKYRSILRYFFPGTHIRTI
ncbi:MAG: SpoIID/LytB domain-containing protein [Spirochaetia bacterium]|nr:SpoIID/LytB domain-containing protein [Spirochaetia bacterium]